MSTLFYETDVVSLNDVNVCKIKAELEGGNIRVHCHTPIIDQWRKSEPTVFKNGMLDSDAGNEIQAKTAEFLKYEPGTLDYKTLGIYLESVFNNIKAQDWYEKPLCINNRLNMPLYNEKGFILGANVAEVILQDYKFTSFKDNDEMLIYDSGVYVPGAEVVIKILVQNEFKNKSSARLQGEIINYIRTATYTDRANIYRGTRYINLLNGIYDREKRELLPHSPDFIFTYQIPVMHDKGAKCPNIEKFFNDVLQPQDIQCVLEFFGYCLIPDTTLQYAVMFVGKGANGKSKMLGLLNEFIGKNNTSSESLQKLESSPYSCAELFGKLVNIFPDLPGTAMFENSMFKTLTGDEALIRAERKYKDPFTFKNTARLIFSANTAPRVPGGDYAYFRRWLLFEFLNTFAGDKQDKDILKKITTQSELSGLLNLALSALDGLMEQKKYNYSKSVEQVEKMYLVNSDPIAAFVDECVVYSDAEYTHKRDMYQAYAMWCKANRAKQEAENILAKRLKRLGFEDGRESTGSRGHIWENRALKRPELSNIQNLPNSLNPSRVTQFNLDDQKTVSQDTVKTCPSRLSGLDSNCLLNSAKQENNTDLTWTTWTNQVYTVPTDNENSPSRLELCKPGRSPYRFIFNLKKLEQFCNDWEFVNRKSINSIECVQVAMEFCPKFKVSNIEEVIQAIKKIRGIA